MSDYVSPEFQGDLLGDPLDFFNWAGWEQPDWDGVEDAAQDR